MSESPFEEENGSQITLNLTTQHVNAVAHLDNNCAADINDTQTTDEHGTFTWFGPRVPKRRSIRQCVLNKMLSPSPYKSRVQRPCSFDMLHHLARRLFQGLNGQINHATDCGQEMNGCSIIRLRPNLPAIGQQKPGAPQLPHRLFRLFASTFVCLLHPTLHFLRREESCFAPSRQDLFVANNLRCTVAGGALVRISVGTCFRPFAMIAKGLLLLCNVS